jgi:chemotaxis protein MotB
MAKKGDKKGITIIKKEEIIEAGHHGGAWKVAYADFVTAMMAFFLLMWLLNATTEAQRRGLADYFSPTIATARGTSGSGKPFGGHSPFEDGPALSDRGTLAVMSATSPPVDVEDDNSDTLATRTVHSEAVAAEGPDGGGTSGHAPERTPAQIAAAQKQAADARRQEQVTLTQAVAALQQAVTADPALTPLAKQLSIDLTPQGLRVQIRDEERRPMFATGSIEPNGEARALLLRLIPILQKLPEPVSIAGYTDAAPYSGTGRTTGNSRASAPTPPAGCWWKAGFRRRGSKDVTGNADRDR